MFRVLLARHVNQGHTLRQVRQAVSSVNQDHIRQGPVLEFAKNARLEHTKAERGLLPVPNVKRSIGQLLVLGNTKQAVA